METIEAQIKNHFLNRKITDIEFYNINDNYFVFDPETTWVFDGGVQLKFGEQVFSFGYNNEERGFDYSTDSLIDTFFGELDYYAVDAKQTQGVKELIGKEILDIELTLGYYHEYDENFELKEEKIYIPVGIKLKFSDDKYLNIALIKFAVTKDPFTIVNAQYNLEGGLYISLKNDLEITTIDTE